ncbi:uncharacterized protein LOC144148459 [Haemaphysalis longicornis]
MQTGQETSDAETTSDGTSGATNSAGTDAAGAVSGSRKAKSPPLSDSARVMRMAIRALRLRLDRASRRITELSYDNQTLSSRLTFLRSENAKLHQALDKERVKLRTAANASTAGTGADAGVSGPGTAPGAVESGGSPTSTSAARSGSTMAASQPGANASSTLTEQETWPLPTAHPGRSSLLVDVMTPSTSSASLEAILIPWRRLSSPPPLLPLSPQQPTVAVMSPPPPPPLPLAPSATPSAPVLCLGRGARSTASFQDVSEGPFFAFTDIFEDGSTEDSISVNPPGSRNAASSETVPLLSTAVKQASSDTTVAKCDEAATASTTAHDGPLAPGTPQQNFLDRNRMNTGTPTREGARLQHTDKVYEPKYSVSTSSLD